MYLIGKWNKTKETQRKQDENTEEKKIQYCVSSLAQPEREEEAEMCVKCIVNSLVFFFYYYYIIHIYYIMKPICYRLIYYA